MPVALSAEDAAELLGKSKPKPYSPTPRTEAAPSNMDGKCAKPTDCTAKVECIHCGWWEWADKNKNLRWWK